LFVPLVVSASVSAIPTRRLSVFAASAVIVWLRLVVIRFESLDNPVMLVSVGFSPNVCP
jgi:hypothetical protein